jgi:hypothetical protein
MDARHIGLDELMIINPGRTGVDAVLLGGDGVLYPLRRMATARPIRRRRLRPRPPDCDCDCDCWLMRAGRYPTGPGR